MNLRLGPQGEVLGWLVMGPFPNETDKDFKECRGFEADRPKHEAFEKPAEDKRYAGGGWRLAIADKARGVDFVSIYQPQGTAVAYAYAAVIADRPTDARLLIGSDDGVKAWVNGTLVHTNHVTRGVDGEADKVDIKLNSGANHLLFKVDQHYGGWGLRVQVVGRDGAPLPGLVEALEIVGKAAESEILLFDLGA